MKKILSLLGLILLVAPTACSLDSPPPPPAVLREYNVAITIRHYGDTKNAPYGEKTPEQIAALASAGVIKTLADGADLVFIACNTASTQYHAI